MKFIPLRAAIVMASIYGYFLLFAQFAFVELLRAGYAAHPLQSIPSGSYEKIVLGTMAVAGILSGFCTAWRGVSVAGIRMALLVAAGASLASPVADGAVARILISLLTGTGLGIATVSAATLLRSWCGLPWVGLGTGVGYACCNLPFVFSQPPAHQAWIATGFAVLGAMSVPPKEKKTTEASQRIFPFGSVLVLFTALVWMDSAAFFIIQHTREMKDGTWNDALLWRNAMIHLGSAVLAGWWMKRDGARILPLAAWILLALAAMAVNVETTRGYAG